jgi:YD repeat-containing protein
MSTVVVKPGNVIEKDTNENRVIQFDWDTDGNLAAAVTISTSTWVITAIRPASETPVALANDNSSILSGSRKTQTRLTGGTLGSEYRVTNRVVTSESPAQTKERSIYVAVVEL